MESKGGGEEVANSNERDMYRDAAASLSFDERSATALRGARAAANSPDRLYDTSGRPTLFT